MNPEPAVRADQPFVVDGRVWRRIVIALYLASSFASALLTPGLYDLICIPELVWIANIVIVLAAIVLARSRAPLRLQLALAFAKPVLYMLLVSRLGVFCGDGFLLYSQFLGSVVAFGIALASYRPSNTFRLMFSALGWVLVAMWVYIHGFELAIHLPGSRPYMDGVLLRILGAAVMFGGWVSPLWIVGAIGLAVSSFRRKQRPALADTAVLVLVFCLMGLFLALGLLLD
jgi:hypothetical protein